MKRHIGVVYALFNNILTAKIVNSKSVLVGMNKYIILKYSSFRKSLQNWFIILIEVKWYSI